MDVGALLCEPGQTEDETEGLPWGPLPMRSLRWPLGPVFRLLGGLLARCWPCDRTLIGLKVSSRVREELLQHAELVLLVRRNPFEKPERKFTTPQFFHTLMQFRFSKIDFRWTGGCDNDFVLTEVLNLASQTEIRSKLVSLNLQNFDLADDDLGGLPPLLSHFQNLGSLNLDTNSIQCPGAEALCRAVGEMTALKELSIRYNDLGVEAMRNVGNTLGMCTKLQDLHVDVPVGGALPLFRGLGRCSRLKALTLTSDAEQFEIMDVEMAELLGAALGQSPEFEHLSLGFILDDQTAVRLLGQGLRGCRGLRTLDLSGTKMEEGAVVELVGLLRECVMLCCLDLSHTCRLRAAAVPGLAAWVSRLLLKSLYLDGVLEDEGLGELARVCRGGVGCGVLEELSLCDCRGAVSTVATPSMTELARWVSACRGLRALCLDSTPVTSEVLGAMVGCRALENLSLRRCMIGPDAAPLLATALAGFSLLTRLYLAYNPLGEAGGPGYREVAAGLQGCVSLVGLDLRGTGSGDDGAGAVVEAAGGLRSLQILVLKHCGIGEKGAGRLARGLAECPTLVELKVKGNPLGGAGEEELRAVWRGREGYLDINRDDDDDAAEAAAHQAAQH